jgi:hypothetical protein
MLAPGEQREALSTSGGRLESSRFLEEGLRLR